MPSTCSNSPQQFGQPRFPVQVHPVVGRVLRHDDQFADAIGRQLPASCHHLLDRLGGVLAAHLGNRAERAQPIAAFGDLQVGEMAGRDSQSIGVGQSADRGRPEDGPLLPLIPDQPIGDPRDFLTTEDAHQLVDLRPTFQQFLLLPFGQTPRHDDAARPPLPLQPNISSIAANDSSRAASMNPHVFTTTKSAPSGSCTSW